MSQRRRLTVKDIIEAVQDVTGSDEEVVAVMAHLLKTGRLVLKKALGDPALGTAAPA